MPWRRAESLFAPERRCYRLGMGRRLSVALLVLAAAMAGGVGLSGSQASRPGVSTRDTPAQRVADAAVPKGRIAGRVVAADTGRPVVRARVLLQGAGIAGGRGALTDDEGRFEVVELPEGRYTLTAGKTGFITLSYGQRRPLQSGTPIQLADGQQLTGIDFSLPRGSVIAGHVFDENGDPLPGASVRAARYEYAQGTRQLVPVGAATTDDLGAFRIWGLNPGEYYVSATLPPFGPGGRGFGGPPPLLAGRGGRGGPATDSRGSEGEQVGYAPTFYPGVPAVNDARPLSVGLSMEVPNVDFNVLLVRTARVSGHVVNPDGTPVTSGNVTLLPEGGGQRGRQGIGGTFGTRIDWDGSFAMANVTPGRFVLRARGDDAETPQFAVQPLTVGESDLSNLTVILSPAAVVTGTVSFQSTQGQSVPDPGQIRVAAPLVDTFDVGPNQLARVQRNGTFTLGGVQAGTHLFRAQGAPRGWMLKSVLVSGRDVIDTPIELRSGQKLADVQLIFIDRLTEVSGSIADDRGAPVTEFTLLAFPVDEDLWRAQSRHIMTARPDQNGRYQMRGLPAGDYFLVAVDPSEQGEWFEPAYLSAHVNGATRFSLAEGDVKTQDFRLPPR